MQRENDIEAALADDHAVGSEPTLTRRHHLGLLSAGVAALALPRGVTAASDEYPGQSWTQRSPAAVGMSDSRLKEAIRFASSRGGAGFVVRSGYQVASWGDETKPYKLYSATKGFGSLLLGLAIDDGLVALSDRGAKWLPGFGTPPSGNGPSGRAAQVTLKMLATHTAGFDFDGGFEPIVFEPGTQYLYSNGGPNWLADVLTARFKEDLERVLTRRILDPIGVDPSDWSWRQNIYRPTQIQGLARREFGSGIFMSARAFARVGLLMRRRGNWNGRQLIPESYLYQALDPDPDLRGIRSSDSGSYPLRDLNLLIQNNTTGPFPDLPRDTYMFRGKFTQHVVVMPSLGLIVVRVGDQGWESSSDAINSVFRGFARAVS